MKLTTAAYRDQRAAEMIELNCCTRGIQMLHTLGQAWSSSSTHSRREDLGITETRHLVIECIMDDTNLAL